MSLNKFIKLNLIKRLKRKINVFKNELRFRDKENNNLIKKNKELTELVNKLTDKNYQLKTMNIIYREEINKKDIEIDRSKNGK